MDRMPLALDVPRPRCASCHKRKDRADLVKLSVSEDCRTRVVLVCSECDPRRAP